MKKHRKAFEEFRKRSKEELGDKLIKIVLYGSVARDQESEYSDVDVFAIVESKEDKEALEDIAYDVGLDFGVFISLIAEEQDKFEERKEHPFIRNITEKGEIYA